MTISYFDPTGSPGRTYGTTINTITANGTTAADATIIVAPTGWTVVVVQTSISPTINSGVRLPSGAQIGDLVEVYCSPLPDEQWAVVYTPAGEQLMQGNTSVIVRPVNSSTVFRKIASSTWAIMALGST